VLTRERLEAAHSDFGETWWAVSTCHGMNFRAFQNRRKLFLSALKLMFKMSRNRKKMYISGPFLPNLVCVLTRGLNVRKSSFSDRSRRSQLFWTIQDSLIMPPFSHGLILISGGQPV